MWFQQKAAPDLIGKPLHTALPYSLIDSISVTKTGGYEHCGADPVKWAVHAGDPNFNMLNECCLAMNSGNPGGLGFTTISQRTMDYVVNEGPGREDFVRFWRLLAEAAKGHPSAFAAELMNEPMTIHRRAMFDCWRACAEAINTVIPDMSVSICDVGEGSVLPRWVTDLTGGAEDIAADTVAWIKQSSNVFYTWHYGKVHQQRAPRTSLSCSHVCVLVFRVVLILPGLGKVPEDVHNMQALSKEWGVPTFATETGCEHFDAAAAAGISHSYWHYSSYCTSGPSFGNRSVPDATFGACILGWGGGDSSKCAKPQPQQQ
jgi:hypothetical protein